MSARTLGVSRTVVRWCTVGLVVAGCAGALLVGVGTMQRASAESTAVDLAGAASFAVLTSGTVTGAGRSSITGDVGGSTVTGLQHRVTGAVSTGGGNAQALADLNTADDAVASNPVTTALSTVSGTLRPGTYGVSGPIDVPGELTLDAGGDADATFIIKTDAAFTTDAATSITLAGGARACNVFWLSGGAATIEGTVVGTVFGRSGITARRGATVTGQLFARSGAVRLDGATVRVPTDCDGAPGTGGTGPVPAPTPTTADDPGSGPSRSTEGATKPDTRRETERDTDGAAARGNSRGTTDDDEADSPRTGGDRGSAGAGSSGGRAGAGGNAREDARDPDAAGDSTPAPGTARRLRPADEPADRSSGAPVVTAPDLEPDGADDGEPGLGRRVLGVLGSLPRSGDSADGGADGTAT